MIIMPYGVLHSWKCGPFQDDLWKISAAQTDVKNNNNKDSHLRRTGISQQFWKPKRIEEQAEYQQGP